MAKRVKIVDASWAMVDRKWCDECPHLLVDCCCGRFLAKDGSPTELFEDNGGALLRCRRCLAAEKAAARVSK